jgi:CBS domain-containing protein
MADRWSLGLADHLDQARARIEAPTPEAVLETDVFLDLRPLAGTLDVAAASQVQLTGADSPRLMHGLALAANGFPPPRLVFGRLPHGEVDVKRTGLAPIVLLARLYGLQARSVAVSTPARLRAAATAGVLSEELTERLVSAFLLMGRLRLAAQLEQVAAGVPVCDRVAVSALDEADQAGLRDAFRAVRAAQTATTVAFRTDLSR